MQSRNRDTDVESKLIDAKGRRGVRLNGRLGLTYIQWNKAVPFAEMWMDLESFIQSEESQKEKNKYHMLTHMSGIYKNGTDELICKAEIETQM